MYMYSYVVLDANNIVEKTIIIYVYIYISKYFSSWDRNEEAKKQTCWERRFKE